MADLPCAPPSGSTSFDKPDVNAANCQFQIKFPSFAFGVTIPSLPFPPILPFPTFGFELSCDPSKPINVSAGLAFGGGRVACFDTNPDQSDV